MLTTTEDPRLMLYYIDGYNVTKRDPATRHLPLERQRDALERRMQAFSRSLLGKDSTYRIVWDGAGGVGIAHRGGVHAEYTSLPTADDAIVEHVRAADVCVGVVTSDRDLVDRCKHAARRRVQTLPSETLFEHTRGQGRATAHGADGAKGGNGRRESPDDAGERLTREVGIPDDADEINRELKELWGIED